MSKKIEMIRKPLFYGIYIVAVLLLFAFNKIFIALGMAIAFVASTRVRYFVANVDNIFRSFVVNSINYFRYKEWNYPDMIGNIDVFTAHDFKVFGCCKTLLAVKRARDYYKRFNGATTYDYKCQNPHWITWKVNVLSNVEIKDIPVTPLVSMNQLVELSDQDTDGVFTIVVIDEANATLNSRNFKSNFQNEEQINAIVTCRHNNIYMMMTGQRFGYLDSLVRSLACRVFECVHIPLINTAFQFVYSAYDLNNLPNPLMIKRIGMICSYLTNEDYTAYDTKALVGMLAKDPSISSAELLAQKGFTQGVENVRHLSRKGRKLMKK